MESVVLMGDEDVSNEKSVNGSMVLFPFDKEEEIEEEEERVLLPGASKGLAHKASSVRSDQESQQMVDELLTLPFPSSHKTSFYGLPLRVKWFLWVELAGWQLEEAERWANVLIFVQAELGRDGHYFVLRTPSAKGARCSLAAPLPRQLMCSFHRSSLLKLSLVRASDNTVLGHAYVALKDLPSNKPRVGWVKIKEEHKDSSGKRRAVARCGAGFRLSSSCQAELLLLVDMREREVLLFQGVETLEDLNPVFLEATMKPFRWNLKGGVVTLMGANKNVLCTLQASKCKGTNTVRIVRADSSDFWQCTLTHETDASDFVVEGSWRGRVTQTRKNFFDVFRQEAGDERVAHSEWRNNRDVKLSIDNVGEDPAIIIAIKIAMKMCEM